jgi:hypothetical protein
MTCEEKIIKTLNILQNLHGVIEYAPTPFDVCMEMTDEIPKSMLLDNSIIIRDAHCGRATLLVASILKMFQQHKINNEEENVKILSEIVSNRIYGNDISRAFSSIATATMQRILGVCKPINIYNDTSMSYNRNMNNKHKIISITNPPYQPMIGVKKGGNEYKPHVLNELKQAPLFGVANIPMTFMVQDPYDRQNVDFRNKLLKAGLKKVKHIRPDAYKANVLTVYIVWEQGYEGDVEFVTYDIDDVNKNHTLCIPRKDLYNLGIWPVARNKKDFDLALEILSYKKRSYKNISNKPSEKADWCVEWEYLIGLEKERLNRKEPVRGIIKRGPNDTVRGGNKSKFVNVISEDAADSLVDFFKTVGQVWQQCIPRGSSVENWMMGPVIQMWLDQNPQYASSDLFKQNFVI